MTASPPAFGRSFAGTAAFANDRRGRAMHNGLDQTEAALP